MAESTQDLINQHDPRPNTVELTSTHAGAGEISDGVDYEPHPENSLSVSREHQQIIDSITKLYSGGCSEEVMQVYAEKAIYDDPLSFCDTRYKIAGQWYGLPMVRPFKFWPLQKSPKLHHRHSLRLFE